MPLFEIINPSDAYTIKTDRWDLAVLATLFLGEGKYGLEEIRGERRMPPFIFGGVDEWLKEQFGAESLNAFIESRMSEELCQVIDSVLIGSACARVEYEDAISRMTAEAAADYAEAYRDRKRSSMNNIGAYAVSLARSLRKKLKAALSR